MTFKAPYFVKQFAAMSFQDQVLTICMTAVAAGYLIKAIKK